MLCVYMYAWGEGVCVCVCACVCVCVCMHAFVHVCVHVYFQCPCMCARDTLTHPPILKTSKATLSLHNVVPCVQIMDNKQGQLCGHYPSEIIILEGHLCTEHTSQHHSV